MNDILPRPARESDIALMDEWLRLTPNNLFDSDILDYPKNVSFQCASNGSPLMFMPVQSVWMLESLAVKPGATELEVAKSIAVIIQTVLYKAEEKEINEVYFLCRDSDVSAYAEKHKWEPLMHDTERNVTLFRWKVRR